MTITGRMIVGERNEGGVSRLCLNSYFINWTLLLVGVHILQLFRFLGIYTMWRLLGTILVRVKFSSQLAVAVAVAIADKKGPRSAAALLRSMDGCGARRLIRSPPWIAPVPSDGFSFCVCWDCVIGTCDVVIATCNERRATKITSKIDIKDPPVALSVWRRVAVLGSGTVGLGGVGWGVIEPPNPQPPSPYYPLPTTNHRATPPDTASSTWQQHD
jgi:hypothetical protein